MNFLPLILGFLLFKAMPSFGSGGNSGQSQQGQNTQNNNNKGDFGGGILNNLEDAQQALQLVSAINKIKENKADISEVMGEIISNPIAMGLISKMGFGGQQNFDVQSSQEEPPFASEASSADGQLNQNITEDKQQKNAVKEVSREPDKDSSSDEKSTDEQTFKSAETPADTLFKPVENIAGVELTKQLKKYYENWYVN